MKNYLECYNKLTDVSKVFYGDRSHIRTQATQKWKGGNLSTEEKKFIQAANQEHLFGLVLVDQWAALQMIVQYQNPGMALEKLQNDVQKHRRLLQSQRLRSSLDCEQIKAREKNSKVIEKSWALFEKDQESWCIYLQEQTREFLQMQKETDSLYQRTKNHVTC